MASAGQIKIIGFFHLTKFSKSSVIIPFESNSGPHFGRLEVLGAQIIDHKIDMGLMTTASPVYSSLVLWKITRL